MMYLQAKAGPSRAPTQPAPSKSMQASTSAYHHPPKKKLFLTDGWSVPLTGICIYMFRLNISKQLPEEGFHKVFIMIFFFSFRVIFSRIKFANT
jgi:dynein heavy chain